MEERSFKLAPQLPSTVLDRVFEQARQQPEAIALRRQTALAHCGTVNSSPKLVALPRICVPSRC